MNIPSIRNFRVCNALRSEERTIKVPPFAESISEGDIRWEKKVGDSVRTDEVIGEIETDKTAVPIPAPCDGVITALLVGDGEKVLAGQDIYKIQPGTVAAGAAKAPAAAAPAKVETPTKKQTPAEAAPTTAPPASETPPGKPIKVVQPPPDLSSLRLGGSESASAPPATGELTRGEQRVKMNRMRLRIAQRLKDAQNTCAMLTTFNEVDMSNLLEVRQLYKDAFQKKHGVKLGIMSAFTKGAATALQDQPIVNAVIDGTDIIYRDYVDVSIAVATPKGLVVPVMRDVGRMNYAEIEKAIFDLGEKARLGTLAVEDMDGGTFTISNGGVFGSLMGTPIINPPQSAILGLHGTFDRPVARNGQVVIRPMMYLALTYDHRLVDGREAVTFLRRIKAFVEDPRTFLLGL